MISEIEKKEYCEESGKICYTERAAGNLVNRYRRHQYNSKMFRNEIPKRKYYCKGCGFYHLTHFGKYHKKYDRSAS